MSIDFGPAVVGVLQPRIVVPAWVLDLDASAQDAIIAHEDEHRVARDPLLRLMGLTSLVLMPWNPGLWFIWRGLRRTIELDCDARVVRRGIGGERYASVLIGAYQRAQRVGLPSLAFVEGSSQLGARVEHLMRSMPRGRRMKTMTGVVACSLLVAAACMTPEPRIPTSAPTPHRLLIVDLVKRPELERYPNPAELSADSLVLDATEAQSIHGADGKLGAVYYYTKAYLKSGGVMVETPRSAAEGSSDTRPESEKSFAMLFRGIELTPAQHVKAHEIIERELRAQEKLYSAPILAVWPERVSLNRQRERELRGVVTDPSALALLEEQLSRVRLHDDMAAWSIEEGFRMQLMRGVTSSDADIARAKAMTIAWLNDEADLYRRSPAAVDQRRALLDSWITSIRGLAATDAERARVDSGGAGLRNWYRRLKQ